MKSSITSLVVAALLAGAGFGTFAQTASQDPARTLSASGAGEHHGPKGKHGKMDPSKRDAMVAKRLAELKTKLNITTDQEGAWTAFTTAMKPVARTEHQRPDRAELDKLTTPERIDKMRALRTQHRTDRTQARDKRADATKAFYAALNTDQKRIFDAELTRMARRHDGHQRARQGG